MRQLLEEGFFHADPHPGNLVATEGGSLAYFDFGMMGDIPRHYRVGLIQMVCETFLNLFFIQLMNLTKSIVFHSNCGNWKGQKGLDLDVVLLNHLTIFVSFSLTG